MRNGSLSLKNGSRTPTWPKSARSKYLPRIFPQSLGVSNAMFDYWKVARYRQPLQSFHFVLDWAVFFQETSAFGLKNPWFQLQFPFYIHLLTPLRYSNKWNNGNLVPRDFTPENLLFVDGKKIRPWQHQDRRSLQCQNSSCLVLSSGKRLHNYRKSPFSMGKSTINGHFQ